LSSPHKKGKDGDKKKKGLPEKEARRRGKSCRKVMLLGGRRSRGRGKKGARNI